MTRGTNILVPASAHAALELIRVRRGYRSRSQFVHTLLSENVCAQRALDPEARLMHLATLLRYPPPRKLADLAGKARGRCCVSRSETTTRSRFGRQRDLWGSDFRGSPATAVIRTIKHAPVLMRC